MSRSNFCCWLPHRKPSRASIWVSTFGLSFLFSFVNLFFSHTIHGDHSFPSFPFPSSPPTSLSSLQIHSSSVSFQKRTGLPGIPLIFLKGIFLESVSRSMKSVEGIDALYKLHFSSTVYWGCCYLSPAILKPALDSLLPWFGVLHAAIFIPQPLHLPSLCPILGTIFLQTSHSSKRSSLAKLT